MCKNVSNNASGITNNNANDKSVDRNINSGKTSDNHHNEPNEPNVLIYFHGNAGNVGHRIELATHYVNNLHCAVMMVDYRGYGLSSPAIIDQDGL